MAKNEQNCMSRKRAIIKDLHDSETGPLCFFMLHADTVFNELIKPAFSGDPRPKHVLQYTDCWTGIQQQTEFETEVELLKFMADYLSNDQGPTEEFMKRFPLEFQEQAG